MILCIVGALLIHVVILIVPALSALLGISVISTEIYYIIAFTTIITIIVLEIVKLIIAKFFVKK